MARTISFNKLKKLLTESEDTEILNIPDWAVEYMYFHNDVDITDSQMDEINNFRDLWEIVDLVSTKPFYSKEVYYMGPMTSDGCLVYTCKCEPVAYLHG